MIPAPKETILSGGELKLTQEIRLDIPGSISSGTAELITQDFFSWYEAQTQHLTKTDQAISLSLHKFPALPAVSPEMYAIVISDKGITISASSEPGFVYGIASLRQMVYIAIKTGTGIPCGRIIDEPKYKWRGLHLDVSRHFFTVDFIKQYLCWMSELKLNRFHWHLTDDQGWRIEILRYPLLTEKGAWRTEPDGSLYGGFYTQSEIREVVEYALQRGITIVPEIDIPGHSMALLSAYPELACFPANFEPINYWGITDDVLCPGNPHTLSMLKDIFAEIASLFPGEYIHIGGDEVPTTRWESCPKCQAVMKQNKLMSERELQSLLLRELRDYLSSLGKQVIGWDEILEGDISPDTVVMVWQGDGKDATHKALETKNRVVLCPNHYLYFDWKPSSAPDEKGAFGVTDIEKVYSLSPASYDAQRTGLILGGQANLWTERMQSPDDVKYMLFPRAYALAEIFWSSSDNRDFGDFSRRLEELDGYL